MQAAKRTVWYRYLQQEHLPYSMSIALLGRRILCRDRVSRHLWRPMYITIARGEMHGGHNQDTKL
jgi:hypothetical protein